MFYVYVIKNSENKIYIGQTANLEKRLERHNGLSKTKKKSFTRKNSGHCGIWKVFYKKLFATREETLKREKELKSSQGRKFIKSLIR